MPKRALTFASLAAFAFAFAGCDFGRHVAAAKFSLCEIYDAPGLDGAIAQGLNVNGGCCAEGMIGECTVPKPNTTLLVYAIDAKRPDAVNALLARGADVNLGFENGTPIWAAASTAQPQIADELLAHGLSSASRMGGLRAAAHSGQLEIGQHLLASAPPNERAAACAMLECAVVPELVQRGRPELPQQRALLLHAIQSCPDPNLKCETEHLFTAIARDDNNVELVAALLARGTDLSAPERNGRTVKEYLRHFNDYDSRPRIKALLEAAP